MSALHLFLKRASRIARARPFCEENVTLCLGNEASDADSIVSSICLAFLQQERADISFRTQTTEHIFVPVVSVPRSILRLRRETQLLLNFAGLDLSDLICLEDVEVRALSTASKLRSIMLTDHNVLGQTVTSLLPGGEKEAETLVDLVLDHHVDSGAYRHLPAHKRQVAFDSSSNKATAGSACTLVAELLQLQRQAESEPAQEESAQSSRPAPSPSSLLSVDAARDLSVLLLGVICLDTNNLDPRGVGTARDSAAVHALLRTPGVLERLPKGDRTALALFTLLSDAKCDPAFWTELTAPECLSIDYKQFPQKCGAEVGFSSVLLPLDAFLAKDGAAEHVARFIATPMPQGEASAATEERAPSLDMLVIMSTVRQPAYRKELLVASFDIGRVEAITDFFMNGSEQAREALLSPLIGDSATAGSESGAGSVVESSGHHRAVEVSGGRILHFRLFIQGQTKFSRKQIAPLVQLFWEEQQRNK